MNELNTLGRAFNMEEILLTALKGLLSILGGVQVDIEIDGTS